MLKAKSNYSTSDPKWSFVDDLERVELDPKNEKKTPGDGMARFSTTPGAMPPFESRDVKVTVRQRLAPTSRTPALLLLATAGPAFSGTGGWAGPDLCSGASTGGATCSGDQSKGASSSDGFDPSTVETLNINKLTTDIGPFAFGVGVLWQVPSSQNPARDSLTLNIDAPDRKIVTQSGLSRAIDIVSQSRNAGSTANRAGRPINTFSLSDLVSDTPSFGFGMLGFYFAGACDNGSDTIVGNGGNGQAGGDGGRGGAGGIIDLTGD